MNTKTIIAIAAAAVVASLIAAVPLFHSSFAASDKPAQSTQNGSTQGVQDNNNDGETNDDNGPNDSHDDGEQADDVTK